jgi:hypothetical protein
MAFIDSGDNTRPRPRPSALPTPSRPRQAGLLQRPAFSRIDLGQLVRAGFLVLLCLGLSQIARAERSLPVGAVAAAPSRF